MAISRRTQKDVGSFEPKFIGPFTTRQTIFVGIAAVICYIVHAVIEPFDSDLTTQMIIMVIFAAPFLAIGFVKPYGMKCEDFLIMYWFYHYKAPAQRKYVTETDVDIIILNEKKSDEKLEEKPDDKSKKRGKEEPKHKKDKQIKEYL